MIPNKVFKVGEWVVEPALDRIRNDAETRSLRPQVMELLVYLADRPGTVVSTDELLSNLWDGRIVSDGSVYNCVSELRSILSYEGSTEPAIETIAKKGYRLLSPVSPYEPVESKPIERRSLLTAAVFVAVIAIVTAWVLVRDSEGPEIRSLAVLPLENHSPDPARDAYFTYGMTETLIARLSKISGLKVISRTSSMQLNNSDMTVPEIAKALNVDGVIEGSVLTADDEVRITLQLIDGESDAHLWANSYIRDFDDVLHLQEEIANSIAGELRVQWIGGQDDASQATLPAARPATTDPNAYRAYLKGRYAFSQFGDENFRTALNHYEEATTLDPTFALAYAAMAEACMQPSIIFSGTRTLEDCERDARRATTLDDDLAEAFAMLGYVQLINWEWQQSERNFERAIDLDQNSVMARQWFSLVLRSTYRFEESLEEIRRAEELDPLNLFVKTMVGWPLYNQGLHEQALAQWDDVIEMNPDFMLAHYNKGLSYIELRQPDEVFAAAERVASLAGDRALEARLLNASGHAIEGERDQAIEILEGVEQDAGPFFAAWIASVYLMLGDEEQALSRLEKGLEDRSPDLLTISEPKFDSVRDHPRFLALSRALGLPAGDSGSAI